MERVLIKGAGDLATGIGCRLHRCGFSVAMTEIAVPTTVRRTVAFSRAVYEGSALVEDVEGVLCRNTGDIDRVVNQDKVAVIVDESCETVRSWKPDIVVDAILAKVNLGTEITDADIVIGVGPGFTAGVENILTEYLRSPGDETKRRLCRLMDSEQGRSGFYELALFQMRRLEKSALKSMKNYLSV